MSGSSLATSAHPTVPRDVCIFPDDSRYIDVTTHSTRTRGTAVLGNTSDHSLHLRPPLEPHVKLRRLSCAHQHDEFDPAFCSGDGAMLHRLSVPELGSAW
jgi:hypothetical protein